MQSSNVPVKFPIPFAEDAGSSYIRQVPTASQIGIVNGAASLHDGFPPLCFTPVGSGGVPPFGQDMNGILNQSTAWDQWFSAGGPVVWDSTFSSAIGGYPKGAIVQSASTFGVFYFNTIENNTSNPDSGGAGWSAFKPGSPIVHYALDTSSTPGVISCNISPGISAYAEGLIYEIIPAQSCSGTTTANFNGLGTRPVLCWGGSQLEDGDYAAGQPLLCVDDGSHIRIVGFVPSDIANVIAPVAANHYGTDSSGSANSIVVSTTTPAFSSGTLEAGTVCFILVANTVTGATTATINGVGPYAVLRDDTGGQLNPSDIIGNTRAELVFDGVDNWILMNPAVPSNRGYRNTSPIAGSTTFTVPTGVTKIRAQGWGGGGGGGAGYAGSTPGAGGGGAGGGYFWTEFSVTPGEVLTLTIGAGGAAGIVGTQNGQSGGQTGIAVGSGSQFVYAEGGAGGQTAATSGTTGTGGTPGAGSAASILALPGYAGASGFSVSTSYEGGFGGASGFGTSTTPSGPGFSGFFPGGGGGGAANNNTPSNAGANGFIILEY